MTKATFTINHGPIGYAYNKNLPQEYKDIIKSTIETWYEVFTCLSEFHMSINQPVMVQFDWGKVKSGIKSENWDDPWDTRFEITTAPDDDAIVEHYAEVLLHHLFLILNLSTPSCLDLYNVKVTSDDGEIEQLNLSSDAWFEAWRSAITTYHINIARLPVDVVLNWYISLKIGVKQISTNSIERALFALLRYAATDDLCPSTLLWLRHALKALFGNITPDVLAFKLQQNSIISPEQSETIQRVISDFYDLTDRFVNGEYNIYYPMENDLLDGSVNDLHLEISNTYRPILAIIIASIQHMILEYREEQC